MSMSTPRSARSDHCQIEDKSRRNSDPSPCVDAGGATDKNICVLLTDIGRTNSERCDMTPCDAWCRGAVELADVHQRTLFTGDNGARGCIKDSTPYIKSGLAEGPNSNFNYDFLSSKNIITEHNIKRGENNSKANLRSGSYILNLAISI